MMETKIFVLIAVCCVLVQGNSLDSPQLKQQLLSKFLSLARGQDARRRVLDSTDAPPRPEGKNMAINQLQLLLGDISNTLSVFKDDYSDGNDEELQKEIARLETAIKELDDKLIALDSDTMPRLGFALNDLYIILVTRYGEDFEYAWYYEMEKNTRTVLKRMLDQQMSHDIHLGNDDITPEQRLNNISNTLDAMNSLADSTTYTGDYMSGVLEAINSALRNVTSENTTVSTKPSVTTPTASGTTAPPATAPPTTAPTTTAPPTTDTTGPTETTTSWWGFKRAKKNKQQDEQLIRNRLVEILKKELHRHR